MIPGSYQHKMRLKKSRKTSKSYFEKQTATLDRWFSLYIRLKGMDNQGLCVCVSCGKLKPWDGGKTHAGHFIGKGKTTFMVRWDERNVGCQCYHCNSNLEGNKYNFAKHLIFKYGEGICEKLQIESTKYFNPLIFGMEQKISYYKTEVRLLKMEKGVR